MICEKQIDDNWLYGRCLEDTVRKGIFPMTHVKRVNLMDEPTAEKFSMPHPARAIREFKSDGIESLPNYQLVDLYVGDYLLISGSVDPNWYVGENHLGKKGIFPVNCVELISNGGMSILKFLKIIPFLGF